MKLSSGGVCVPSGSLATAFSVLVLRVAVELRVGKPNVAEEVVVDAQPARGVVAIDADRGDHVVLIDAVAGDAEAAHVRRQAADGFVDAAGAGEEDDAVLVLRIDRIAEVGARVEGIEAVDA